MSSALKGAWMLPICCVYRHLPSLHLHCTKREQLCFLREHLLPFLFQRNTNSQNKSVRSTQIACGHKPEDLTRRVECDCAVDPRVSSTGEHGLPDSRNSIEETQMFGGVKLDLIDEQRVCQRHHSASRHQPGLRVGLTNLRKFHQRIFVGRQKVEVRSPKGRPVLNSVHGPGKHSGLGQPDDLCHISLFLFFLLLLFLHCRGRGRGELDGYLHRPPASVALVHKQSNLANGVARLRVFIPVVVIIRVFKRIEGEGVLGNFSYLKSEEGERPSVRCPPDCTCLLEYFFFIHPVLQTALHFVFSSVIRDPPEIYGEWGVLPPLSAHFRHPHIVRLHIGNAGDGHGREGRPGSRGGPLRQLQPFAGAHLFRFIFSHKRNCSLRLEVVDEVDGSSGVTVDLQRVHCHEQKGFIRTQHLGAQFRFLVC
mmetsp:Transcript_16285/g.33030  ORF Transcript_16285/g.33030 Transcript_16285/m.33030 type:complete len:423 (-) Transcript_16285:410-1678(-)